MIFEIIAGAVVLIIGLGFTLFGLAAVSAGRGGYGRGPFPMLKQPRDSGLIGLGYLVTLLGIFFVFVGQAVIMG